MGDSFSGLETEKTPALLEEIDSVFPTLWFWYMLPGLCKVLGNLPFSVVQNFLKAASEFRRVSSSKMNMQLSA